MEWLIAIVIFVLSCTALYIAGELVVTSLVRLSQALRLSTFVISFLVMGIAASLPNLIVGIQSSIKGIPELSLGDIFGNNLVALTLAASMGVLFSLGKKIEIKGFLLRKSVLFASIAGLTPLLLILDHNLSRSDGVVLLVLFTSYITWVFTRKEKDDNIQEVPKGVLKNVLFNFQMHISFLKVILGTAILFLSAQGIIYSSVFFATSAGLPLLFIGLVIVGFGSALPEVYFAIASARRGEVDIIIGNLLGSVIVPATMVLGIVSIIHPIVTEDIPFLALSRIFLFMAISAFFVFAGNDNVLNKKEAYVLISIYILFILSAIISASI